MLNTLKMEKKNSRSCAQRFYKRTYNLREFGDFTLLLRRGRHVHGHCCKFCFSCFKWRQIIANSQVWSLLFLEGRIALKTSSLNVACVASLSFGVCAFFFFLLFDHVDIGTRAKETEEGKGRVESFLSLSLFSPPPFSAQNPMETVALQAILNEAHTTHNQVAWPPTP